ncbi:MAG: dipeptide epimerase [Planctomycetes bacterium]|nr:dipeptide epimerase [Planctomycetota bacterium]
MSGEWRLVTVPFTLQLAHRFTLANSSRTTTPTLLVELHRDGIIGYGEAAMPPYLGEDQQTAAAFLARIDLRRFRDPFQTAAILAEVDAIAPGNTAAKAAFDIALHDWLGKAMGQPWYRVLGLDPGMAPRTSYTIGIHAPEIVRGLAREASARFSALKIKLGGEHDRAMIAAIREVCSTPIRVDVNQGWHDRAEALDRIGWLATQGVELVEQPLPADRVDDLAWLRERSPLPLVADEGVQRLGDVKAAVSVYDGINVKLMKCSGLREGRLMIELARALGLRVMLGCMTESSCAISAAAQLAPLVDWADLDGALLVSNDPFTGADLVDGRIVPSDRPGIGASPRTAAPPG